MSDTFHLPPPPPPPPPYINNTSTPTANVNANVTNHNTSPNPNSNVTNYNYVIGNTPLTDPLVKLSHVKGHLVLLRSFSELKAKVEGFDFGRLWVPRHQDEDKERKWKWTFFVGLAVERFDVWCRSITEEDCMRSLYSIIPPVDVVMVWHTYMLNPLWYKDDCARIDVCRKMKSLERHFEQLLLDPSIMTSNPPAKPRVDHWEFNTRLGFDLFDDARNMVMVKKAISCPMCDAVIQVDYVNDEGTGYLQWNFKTACFNQGCTFGEIDKEKLALGKLSRDLARPSDSDNPANHLPGIMQSSSFGESQVKESRRIKDLVCQAAMKTAKANDNLLQGDGKEITYRQMYLAIMEVCKYSMDMLRRRMGFSYQPTLVGRIVSAYNDDKVYSIDLVGAVLRQGSFVNKMRELGWTSSRFFDGSSNELALQHALSRYHAFLDLMVSSTSSTLSGSSSKFLVPTLDIDLIWHTHQLIPAKYESDCTMLLKRFLDHDDKVEGLRLSSAFDITARAWKDRFGVQYTYCGCPTVGDTIGERLLHAIEHKSKAKAKSTTLLIPPTDQPDALSATHPSDHNSVRFIAHDERARNEKAKRYDSLIEKKEKERQAAVKKAAAKAASVNGSATEVTRDRDKSVNCGFNTAFLFPLPLEFAKGVSSPTAIASDGCIDLDGSVVVSVAGCGSGCGGSGCGGGIGGDGNGGPGRSAYTYQLYPKIM
uniref:Uncharacterized protein n=1 Tax=Psilocybe cubensis TaxID=181762 RepID=A0A8H8CLD4_PSICU